MAEKEYIEREAVLESISGLTWYSKNKKGVLNIGAVNRKEAYYPAGNVFDAIESVSAADVVEVVHGEWIIKTDYKTTVSHAHIRKEKLYICPYCGKDYRQHMNFCGNCGAKMDGATDNNVGGKQEVQK